MFKLRDYQIQLINDTYEKLQSGSRHIMVVSPAGSGKTVTMAEIAKRATDKGNHVLFVVHRMEIVKQVRKSFTDHGVDMKLATVGMINTIEHKKDRIPYPDLIFVDEAHHSLAATYKRLLEYFSKSVQLLFTATPVRLSGEGFTEVADTLIKGPSVSWLIENHNLAPFEYYAPTLFDLESLKVTRGDFSHKSMEEASKKVIWGDVVKNYKKIANGTQAFVYAVDVESSKSIVQEFNSAGISAVHVDGKTSKEERERLVGLFRDGQIKILSNAELFLEGVDTPNVETVIQLRPTQSLSMFIQFSMRSMRYKPGKIAKIIDHVGNYARHGFPDTEHDWTLESTSVYTNTNTFTNVYTPKFNEEFIFNDPDSRRKFEYKRDAELEKLVSHENNEFVLDYRDYSDAKTFEDLVSISKTKEHTIYKAVREAYYNNIPYPDKYKWWVNKFIKKGK